MLYSSAFDTHNLTHSCVEGVNYPKCIGRQEVVLGIELNEVFYHRGRYAVHIDRKILWDRVR